MLEFTDQLVMFSRQKQGKKVQKSNIIGHDLASKRLKIEREGGKKKVGIVLSQILDKPQWNFFTLSK